MIKEHIFHHFKRLFGTKRPLGLQMREGAWTANTNLGELENEFREEEIKNAGWELGPDKAPGPDKLPLFFFRTF